MLNMFHLTPISPVLILDSICLHSGTENSVIGVIRLIFQANRAEGRRCAGDGTVSMWNKMEPSAETPQRVPLLHLGGLRKSPPKVVQHLWEGISVKNLGLIISGLNDWASLLQKKKDQQLSVFSNHLCVRLGRSPSCHIPYLSLHPGEEKLYMDCLWSLIFLPVVVKAGL